MLLFQPKYRLGHPENYLFLLSINIFTGSKYPQKEMILKKESLELTNNSASKEALATMIQRTA